MSDSLDSVPEPKPVNLDINTLVNILKIVDFCLGGGKIEGVDAIRGVLENRDKLAAFLDALPKGDATPAPAAPAPAADATDATV